MFVIVYFFLSILILLSIISLYIKNKQRYWTKRGIIHVEPEFPYGNLKGLQKTRSFPVIFLDLYNKLKGKARYGGIYLYGKPVLLILDLDIIKQILIKDFNYFVNRGVYHNEKDDPLSGHLFSLEGERWRNLRNKLSPTFTSGKMKNMFSTIVDVAKQLKDIILDEIKINSNIEVKDIAARFTTDVIGTCAFGIECSSLKNPNVEFRKIGAKILTEHRNYPIVEAFINIYPNFARAMGMKFTPEDVSEFYMRIVKETIDYREQNNVVRNDFMQLLIQLKNHGNLDGENVGNLTFNEIAAQAFVFFVAGFETSSTVMGFCLYELALHPEIQDKCRKNILEVLKKYNGKITYESVKEMRYLDMVLNETLRKWPPLGHLVRTASKDYKIPGTNDVIEKDIMVVIPSYGIQNDPEFYENPDKFDPERFSLENMANRHPMTFLPFGDGPRNCIGLRFGKMQARVGLAELLSNFKFSKCSKTKIPLKLNPKSPLIGVDEIYLNVEKL